MCYNYITFLQVSFKVDPLSKKNDEKTSSTSTKTKEIIDFTEKARLEQKLLDRAIIGFRFDNGFNEFARDFSTEMQGKQVKLLWKEGENNLKEANGYIIASLPNLTSFDSENSVLFRPTTIPSKSSMSKRDDNKQNLMLIIKSKDIVSIELLEISSTQQDLILHNRFRNEKTSLLVSSV